jgi:hypothetical protein
MEKKANPRKDPVLEIAEFFEALERHRPRKPKRITPPINHKWTRNRPRGIKS